MALTDRLSVCTRRETKIAYKACEWKRIASTYMTIFYSTRLLKIRHHVVR